MTMRGTASKKRVKDFLRYFAEVLLGVFAFAEFVAKADIGRRTEVGVLLQYVQGIVSSLVEHQAVTGERGDVQIDRKSALGSPFRISRAAHFHILLRDGEPVLRAAHQFQSLDALFRTFVAAHQDAV